MCRIQVLKRGRWDFFSALSHDCPFFLFLWGENHIETLFDIL